MTSHVIAYRSLELLFGTHTFHLNCFFEDFNCVFTQIRCLSRVLCLINLGQVGMGRVLCGPSWHGPSWFWAELSIIHMVDVSDV